MGRVKQPIPGTSFYIRPENQKQHYDTEKKPKPKPRKKKALFDISNFNKLCRKSKDAKIRAMVESVKKSAEKNPEYLL